VLPKERAEPLIPQAMKMIKLGRRNRLNSRCARTVTSGKLPVEPIVSLKCLKDTEPIVRKVLIDDQNMARVRHREMLSSLTISSTAYLDLTGFAGRPTQIV
jgi:hypothetical protein